MNRSRLILGPMLGLMLGLMAPLVAPSAPAHARDGREFKVLTYNTWMLRFLKFPIAKDMKIRQALIPYALAAVDADVITLQETWENSVKKEWKAVLRAKGYKYIFHTKRTFSLGDGLLIASKHPIIARHKSKPYPYYPRIDEIFAQKRILGVTVFVPGVGPVHVYTSHLGAINYDRKAGTYTEPTLRRQDKQFAYLKGWLSGQIAKLTQSELGSDRFVFTADLNRAYLELEGGMFGETYEAGYKRLLTDTCGQGRDLLNTFLVANNFSEKDPQVPTYSNQNHYVRTGRFWMFPSEVEDYIFACPSTALTATASHLLFNLDPILSDHYALMTSFDLR